MTCPKCGSRYVEPAHANGFRYKECGEIFPEVLWLTAKAGSQWLNYFYYGRLPRPSVIIHVEPCSEECGQCPIPTDRRKKRP